MHTLFQKIKINRYIFTSSTSVVITKSYTTFTDTAEIVFPNVIFKKKNQPVAQAVDGTTLIKKGDPVKIWAGYDRPFDDLPLRFEGFVTKVDAEKNITVKCEDYTYALKLIRVKSKVYEDTTIGNLINTLLTGTNVQVEYIISENTNIGDFKIENTSYLNVVNVLEEIKSNLGITSYFDGVTLRIGNFFNTSDIQRNFIFQYNMLDGDSLEWNRADDISQVIKGVSILESNEKIERYAYIINGELKVTKDAQTGEQKTLTYYNLTAAKLERTLRDNFQNYVYTGYSGNFTTFLDPYIKPTDKARLFNIRYPERNGIYKVRSVETEINEAGGFQSVELDYKVG